MQINSIYQLIIGLLVVMLFVYPMFVHGLIKHFIFSMQLRRNPFTDIGPRELAKDPEWWDWQIDMISARKNKLISKRLLVIPEGLEHDNWLMCQQDLILEGIPGYEKMPLLPIIDVTLPESISYYRKYNYQYLEWYKQLEMRK